MEFKVERTLEIPAGQPTVAQNKTDQMQKQVII